MSFLKHPSIQPATTVVLAKQLDQNMNRIPLMRNRFSAHNTMYNAFASQIVAVTRDPKAPAFVRISLLRYKFENRLKFVTTAARSLLIWV